MRKLCSISHIVFALGLAGALPGSAYATVLYDEITVQDASGTVFASVSATPAEIIANPDANYFVSGVAVDVTEIGNFGNVIDGDGNALEIFGIGAGGPDPYDLSFGGAGAAADSFPQYQVPDTGAPIDLTIYLDPGLQGLGDTATLLAVPGAAVPEPATWALMLVGFAAIGSGTRRTATLRNLVARVPSANGR